LPGRSRRPVGARAALAADDRRRHRTAAGDDGGYGEVDPDDEPADPEVIARLICLRLLTAAPRTRAQLAEALRRRGVPIEAAEAVLSRFTEVGLIDDATFAEVWVESRHFGRGLGRRALAAELGRRGVGHQDIQAAVARLTAETERATALALVERKIASTSRQPHSVRVRRLTGMLARKGYPAGLAYSVVREALDRAGQDGFDADSEDNDEALGAEFVAGDEFTGESSDQPRVR
jgi:regulatory protein